MTIDRKAFITRTPSEKDCTLTFEVTRGVEVGSCTPAVPPRKIKCPQ